MNNKEILSLIPGTFNPLHEGHLAIYKYCQAKSERTTFLISGNPFDKEGVPSITERRKQFFDLDLSHIVVESRTLICQLREVAGLYALIYGSMWDGFIINIGIDTLSRLNDLKYYENEEHFEYSMDELASSYTKIRAFPRNGVKRIPLRSSLMLHTEFVSSFDEVNISSTEIRNGLLNNNNKG